MEAAEEPADLLSFGDVWQLNYDTAIYNDSLDNHVPDLANYDDMFTDLYARRQRRRLGDRVRAGVAFLQWRELSDRIGLLRKLYRIKAFRTWVDVWEWDRQLDRRSSLLRGGAFQKLPLVRASAFNLWKVTTNQLAVCDLAYRQAMTRRKQRTLLGWREWRKMEEYNRKVLRRRFFRTWRKRLSWRQAARGALIGGVIERRLPLVRADCFGLWKRHADMLTWWKKVKLRVAGELFAAWVEYHKWEQFYKRRFVIRMFRRFRQRVQENVAVKRQISVALSSPLFLRELPFRKQDLAFFVFSLKETMMKWRRATALLSRKVYCTSTVLTILYAYRTHHTALLS
jgi:hypothetical protein